MQKVWLSPKDFLIVAWLYPHWENRVSIRITIYPNQDSIIYIDPVSFVNCTNVHVPLPFPILWKSPSPSWQWSPQRELGTCTYSIGNFDKTAYMELSVLVLSECGLLLLFVPWAPSSMDMCTLQIFCIIMYYYYRTTVRVCFLSLNQDVYYNHFASDDVYTHKTFPNCKTEDVYTRFAALF